MRKVLYPLGLVKQILLIRIVTSNKSGNAARFEIEAARFEIESSGIFTGLLFQQFFKLIWEFLNFACECLCSRYKKLFYREF